MIETGKILQGDCIEVMKTLPLTSVDLVVTSPPYNVGIDYDTHHDSMSMEDYWDFTRQWLTEAFHVLKDDGRIAVNIPYEAIKVIEAWELDFHLGNTVKYISRAGKKETDKELQDLNKALWYLQRRIDNLKNSKI